MKSAQGIGITRGEGAPKDNMVAPGVPGIKYQEIFGGGDLSGSKWKAIQEGKTIESRRGEVWVDGHEDGDFGTETGNVQVRGGNCGGGGIRLNMLGLGYGWGRGGSIEVREVGADTGIQVKIWVNKNKPQCLRL